jgi:hypothetical protein
MRIAPVLKQVFLAAVLVLCAAAAPAPAAPSGQIDRIEILEFGTYQHGPLLFEDPPTATTFGRGSWQWQKHIETTRKIPAAPGTAFGFRYRVVGRPAGSVLPVTQVIMVPPPGVRSPSGTKNFTRDVSPADVEIGEEGLSMFTFDYHWEMLPGIWTFQFWSGSRKLVEQRFEVYLPQS